MKLNLVVAAVLSLLLEAHLHLMIPAMESQKNSSYMSSILAKM
jgi:hypothetical protein